jgi:hypothetical protein
MHEVTACVTLSAPFMPSCMQELLQRMTADMFTERPADPLEWMMRWWSEEKKKREAE